MVMNLLAVIFILAVEPFENPLMNKIGLFNEVVALVISYLIAQINDLRYDPESAAQIGNILVYLIYGSWAVNGFVILGVATKEMYEKAKAYYIDKLRHKFA